MFLLQPEPRTPMSRLFTPGPVEVPQAGLLAMARQVRHHRTPEFRRTMSEVFAELKYVLQTANEVLVLGCSGTGGMEAAVVNSVRRGGKALVLESGKFAERWRLIAERFGIEVVRYELPWGEAFEAAEVARLLDQHPDIAAVFATLQETSTGVGHDIEGIGRVVRACSTGFSRNIAGQPPTIASQWCPGGTTSAGGPLFVVDGISGVGAMECRTDAWGIDVLVVGAQKALMTPPGLAFLSVSPKAWRQIEAIDRPAFYFDLLAYRKAARENETPYTPAIPLVEALAESLQIIRAAGIENLWSRSRRLSQAVLAGVAALGLRPVARRPAEGVSAVYLPDGIDGKAFLARLEERFGIKLAGGQGPLKGKIFRIAQMGQISEVDILGCLAAIELVLLEMGQAVTLGSAVAAAEKVFQSSIQP
jgi:serine---pyruvate transaminase